MRAGSLGSSTSTRGTLSPSSSHWARDSLLPVPPIQTPTIKTLYTLDTNLPTAPDSTPSLGTGNSVLDLGQGGQAAPAAGPPGSPEARGSSSTTEEQAPRRTSCPIPPTKKAAYRAEGRQVLSPHSGMLTARGLCNIAMP